MRRNIGRPFKGLSTVTPVVRRWPRWFAEDDRVGVHRWQLGLAMGLSVQKVDVRLGTASGLVEGSSDFTEEQAESSRKSMDGPSMDGVVLCVQSRSMPPRRFGLYLKHLLEDRGLTQERAATVLGVSEGRISMLISGKTRPKLDVIQEWRTLLGLTEKEAQVLYRLAMLARSPTEVEEEFLRMLGSVTPEDVDGDGDVSP